MSKTTRRRPTPPPSPRYTRARGIGQDRVRWPSGKFRMPFRHLPDTPPAAEPVADQEAEADG